MPVISSIDRFHAITIPSVSMAKVASGRKLMMSARRRSEFDRAISVSFWMTAWRILWESSVNCETGSPPFWR